MRWGDIMKVIVSYPARVEKEIEVDRKWDKLVSDCENYPEFYNAPDEAIDYYNEHAEEFLEEIRAKFPYDELCVDTVNGNSIFEM